MAHGLWCAVRRYSDATQSCGASGTRYVTMRGLIDSRRVPSRGLPQPPVHYKTLPQIRTVLEKFTRPAPE
eukprot:248925-Prymnesium_polylepis.1